MWVVFFFFEFLQRNCYFSKPRRYCLSFVPQQPWRVQDWKTERANVKNIFPPSSYLSTFSEKKSKVCLVLRHQRGAVEGRGTKVNEGELNLKSQLLSECKLEQSNIWDRGNSARWIKMTDISQFSCRTLGAFFSPTNFNSFLVFKFQFPVLMLFSITSEAQLHLLPLQSTRPVLHTLCFLPAFPHLVPQSLLLLIDFCPCSCFTRSNSSCSGQRLSPWPGPQG